MGDRVCLVTGGGGPNIGSAICRAVAARGFCVYVSDVDLDAASDVADSLCAAGCDATGVRMDVASPDEVRETVGTILERHGRIDALVNSATAGELKALASVEPEQLDRVLRIGLRGAWLCSRAVVEPMAEAGGGAIVNIGSVHALGADPGFGAYDMAKAGLVALTRTLASEHGRDGIRVNIVHPGLVVREGAEQDWMDAYVRDSQMIPRIIRPQEVGWLVAYLVSEDAAMITGAQIVIDGGTSAMLYDND